MNNYAQFFDKYTEKTVDINNKAYQSNVVNAVTSYLKSNGYQVTNSSIATGCDAIINQFKDKSTSISADYGKDNVNTPRINNVLATVFPPKQNTAQPVAQQPQAQSPQDNNAQAAQNQGQTQFQPPQNPEGDGSKNPGDNPPKEDLPQDDPMNDLAGISMLTKDELRAMVNKGSLPKIMKDLMDVKKVSKSYPGIKISNIQITGTDNIYDNDDNTSNKSRKSNNKQQNKSNKLKQGNQNGQVKA